MTSQVDETYYESSYTAIYTAEELLKLAYEANEVRCPGNSRLLGICPQRLVNCKCDITLKLARKLAASGGAVLRVNDFGDQTWHLLQGGGA